MATVHGSCLCQSIRLEIAPGALPIKKMTCYCTDCQKGAGGPYQTNAMFSTSEITILDPQNALKTYVVSGTSSGFPKEKFFCGVCGCTMFTRPGHYKGEKTVVKTGVLDNGGTEIFPPVAELYTRDRPFFCHPIEEAKQFETMPGK